MIQKKYIIQWKTRKDEIKDDNKTLQKCLKMYNDFQQKISWISLIKGQEMKRKQTEKQNNLEIGINREIVRKYAYKWLCKTRKAKNSTIDIPLYKNTEFKSKSSNYQVNINCSRMKNRKTYKISLEKSSRADKENWIKEWNELSKDVFN